MLDVDKLTDAEKDLIATTRKVLTQELTLSEAIVIQSCLSAQLPVIASSEPFAGKEPLLLTLSRVLTPLTKDIDAELVKLDTETKTPEQLDLFTDGEQTNAVSVDEYLSKKTQS